MDRFNRIQHELRNHNYLKFAIQIQQMSRFWKNRQLAGNVGGLRSSNLPQKLEDRSHLLDGVMKLKNVEDDMTIVESAFFILFERWDERFIMFLLNEVPHVAKYLHICNS